MVRFKLDKILFGKNKMKVPHLQEISNINKNTLYAIYNNAATRIDLSVIDRLCTALNCQPGDLLEYIPNEREDQH